MKKQIIKLGKKYDKNLIVDVTRINFDIYHYQVYDEKMFFIGVYDHYTGKTSNGITYPTESILIDLEDDLIKLQNIN
jgi:predicted RecB family nuclease